MQLTIFKRLSLGYCVFVILLIGLGVDELSVSPSQAPMIKDVVRKLYYSSAVELAQQALASRSAEHVEALCHKLIEHEAKICRNNTFNSTLDFFLQRHLTKTILISWINLATNFLCQHNHIVIFREVRPADYL